MNQNIKSPLYGQDDNKNIYSAVMIIISLALIFFSTSPIYWSYLEKSEENTTLNNTITSLKWELDTLNTKKEKISKDPAIMRALNLYASDFREDKILDAIYKKANWVQVKDISMEKGQKLPNWLNLASINISLEAKSLNDYNNFITYLTSKDSDMRFVVISSSLPFDSTNTNTTLDSTLNLWMYYFEK